MVDSIDDILSSGLAVGDNKPHVRVTVEPSWQLHSTAATYGGGTRGPYRWWQRADNSQTVIELPNIKSLSIDKNIDQDAASCRIEIFNQWNSSPKLPLVQLGTPGYFWPTHGSPSGDSDVVAWNQSANSWANVLVPNALIRTYEGYGGFVDGVPLSISDAIAGGHLVLTGVWMVDTVSADTSGVLSLSCRDMAKLLIDQFLFPPLVPMISTGGNVNCYPVEYWADGKSPYDDTWTPPADITDPADALTGMNADTGSSNYCVSIARHSVKGFWVLDSGNNVYNYGNAVHYGGGGSLGGAKAVSIAARSDDTGYWTLDDSGTVRAYGAAGNFGSAVSGDDAIEIVPTYTNNGYWILRRNGTINNFGDAPAYSAVAKSGLMTLYEGFGWVTPVDRNTVTGACGHPTGYGLWAVSGNGEVTVRGVAQDFGGVVNRDGLKPHESTHGIEPTEDGGGYWIAFGSGLVKAFGNAADLGNANLDEFVLDALSVGSTGLFFTKLVVDIARDPNNKGFYALRVDGTIRAINTSFWDTTRSQYASSPGVVNDYTQVVKELLLWAGYLLYDGTHLDVYGNLESTGIFTANGTSLGQETFDKKSIMDVISSFKEVVGYICFVDREGGFNFVSPNIWESGNFNLDGTHTSTVPVCHELETVTSHSAEMSGASLRSEVIVSTTMPTFDNSSDTLVKRYTPPSAAFMRGMVSPAIWAEEVFTDPQEVELMAELISLHIWLGFRTSTTECMADPRIDINNQVKIVERITSDVFNHYVRGVSRSFDAESGSYKMSLTTHWLGTTSKWAVTSGTPDPTMQFQMTESLSDWLNSERNLDSNRVG